MTKRNHRKILAAGLTGVFLTLTACDDGLSRSGAYSWVNDPPNVALVAGGKLVFVRFNRVGMGFRLDPQNTIQVPGPVLSPLIRSEFGHLNGSPRQDSGGPAGGLLDPDPDEHEFDPDLWPDPDDEFPLPDPPLPMPDYPDEDPFDGLPEPPPFDPSDLDFTDLSDGSVTTVTSGSTAGPKSQDPSRAIQIAGRTLSGSKIRIGAQPRSLKNSIDRKRLYVSYAQGIAVIDKASASVVDQITLPPEARPRGLAFSRDGKRLYVTSFLGSSAQVYTVDVATKALIGAIPVGGFPAGIAVTPDGSQVWITSSLSGNVTVIDTMTNTRTVVISNVSSAWGIRFNPTGTRAYVTSSEDVGGSLRVIDTARYTVIANIPTGDGARSLAVTPSGRHVFVANHRADTITQIDAITNTVVRTITVGKTPEGFQFFW